MSSTLVESQKCFFLELVACRFNPCTFVGKTTNTKIRNQKVKPVLDLTRVTFKMRFADNPISMLEIKEGGKQCLHDQGQFLPFWGIEGL